MYNQDEGGVVPLGPGLMGVVTTSKLEIQFPSKLHTWMKMSEAATAFWPKRGKLIASGLYAGDCGPEPGMCISERPFHLFDGKSEKKREKSRKK